MNRGIHDIVVPYGPVQVTDGSGALTVDVEEKTLLFATGTASVSGDNTLIAAPGSGQEVVIVAAEVQNESAVETLIILKFGATTKWRFLAKDKGAGGQAPIQQGFVWHVGENIPLTLTLNGNNQIGYNIIYYLKTI
ncbi:MAG: hypothetical protein EKK57_09640 [Proteobacteria bacterium]|nr:MAG: hypothetical protein EKK57_09640 [Pseudomonadota bacterium]